MTPGHDDPARAFGEELRDADLLREIDRFHGRCGMTGTGGRGPDRRRSSCERSADRITHRNGYSATKVLGDPGRHGRAEDPEAEEGLSYFPGTSWSRGGWPRRRWLR